MELTASVVVIHLVLDKTWARTRPAHSAAARARFCVTPFPLIAVFKPTPPALNKSLNASVNGWHSIVKAHAESSTYSVVVMRLMR